MIKTIINEEVKIGIIGLGYVGLPLAIEFSKKYNTKGYDKDKKRINLLRSNFDSTLEVSKKELKNSNLDLHSNPAELKNAMYMLLQCQLQLITIIYQS